MIRPRSILLFVCVINVSSQKSTTTLVQDNPSLIHNSLSVNVRDELRDLQVMIAQLHTRIAQQNTKFCQQDTQIAEQDTKFAVQISEQNTKITEQECKIKDLEIKIDGLLNISKPQPPSESNLTTYESSSIFTRWGRRDCPENVSELVYSGIAGGSHFSHPGGAAEYVCLPPDPIWNINKHFPGPNWAYMYGTEYQEITHPLVDFDVPCAVCRTTQYSTTLLIPARTQCYPGWQEAYHGELVANQHQHPAASQYVCLDENPQTNSSTSKDENGKLMYPVRAQCGSLPCPPYEHNTLITCVVCLK